jgi:hypothetical protein
MKVHQQSTSLMTILEHRRSRALFIEHLRRRSLSAENQLLFYEAVSQFLQLEPSGFKAAARTIAEDIFVEYVPDYAITRVELSPSLTADMLSALNEGRAERYPALLLRARADVYDELAREHLRPFTSSEPFMQMLHTLSSGNDLSAYSSLQEFEA